MDTRTVRRAQYITALGAAAALVAACGADDPQAQSMTSVRSDFTACMVTDLGGVDDKSFNQTSWNGLVAAEEDGLSAEPRVLETAADTPEEAEGEYTRNIQQFVDDDCNLIVTVGFLLGAATKEAADNNPDERFAIVDFQFADADGNVEEIDNVKPLVFNTHEAAYLAGYLAAAQTKTGVVGTWGGLEIGTVTIFMDGYVDGVEKYNEEKGTDVTVLGWDKDSQKGTFAGSFEDSKKGREITEDQVAQGADVIMPVAGPLAVDAAKVAKKEGDVSVIWVDSDGVESAPEHKEVILTSVMKGMDVAVHEAVEETVGANYTNVPYIGTLANGGVGLAPFHEFDDDVSDETKKELADLQRQIIIGELNPESDAAYE